MELALFTAFLQENSREDVMMCLRMQISHDSQK